jgi:FkbM family methyltransferase
MRDEYEPQVWRRLMREIRQGDTFVDVGAYIGLYSIAVGLRLGASGRVWSFEPDPVNFDFLIEHISCNKMKNVIIAVNTAVSNKGSTATFVSGKSSESHLAADVSAKGKLISVVALQEYFVRQRVDVLKIDVEGLEQAVIEGALELLTDPKLRPRAIFVEMHPFAWVRCGASSERILQLLGEAGYHVYSVDGRRIAHIDSYCEVVARPAKAPEA